MNIHLFKKSIKENLSLFIIFTILFAGLMAGTTAAFAEEIDFYFGESFLDISQIKVNPIFKSEFLVYLFGNTAFSIMYVLFISAQILLISTKIIAKEVDNGTMSFYLNTPIGRVKFVLTKVLFLIITTLATFIITFLLIYLSIANKDFAIGPILKGLLLMFAYSFFLSGITFFASCYFNRSGFASMTGAIIFLFYIFHMTSFIGSHISALENFKYLTPMTLLNNCLPKIDEKLGQINFDFLPGLAVFFIIGIILYVLAILYFKKKDLPL